MLWDLNDGKHLYSLEAGDIVNALVFSPNRYWLCAATSSCVKIFDLESKYVFFTILRLKSNLPSNTGRSLTTSRQRSILVLEARARSVCRLRGQQMVRLCSVVTQTTVCAYGRLCRRFVGRSCMHHYSRTQLWFTSSLVFSNKISFTFFGVYTATKV